MVSLNPTSTGSLYERIFIFCVIIFFPILKSLSKETGSAPLKEIAPKSCCATIF